MAQNTEHHDSWTSPARIGRFIGFIFSFGFAFPNVMVEDMDLSAMQRTQQGKLYDPK